MKRYTSNRRKRSKQVNNNEPFFQKKSEKNIFSKPEESNTGFFDKKKGFFLYSTPNKKASIQKKKNGALPEDLKTKMEASFGQDFSNVMIQKNSKKAVQLNALAFTQGNNVHFAPGQYNPNSENGRQLIGHEFAHVAQQRNGVVQPTSVMGKGFTLNKNKQLENEADSLGKKAVQGEAINKYRSSGLGNHNSMNATQAKSKVIQRTVKTWGGEWDTTKYSLITPAAKAGLRGVDIDLNFKPGKNVDAELIGLTQTIKFRKSGKPYFMGDATRKDHSIKSKDAKEVDATTKETDEGTHIDQFKSETNPLYAVTGSTDKDKTLEDTKPGATWGQHGYRYYDASKTLKEKKAILKDTPKIHTASKDSLQVFETTAVAIKGKQKDSYYGSVSWGWKTDSKGLFKKLPLQVASQGVPSSSFLKAAEIWNASKTSKGKDTLNLPSKDVKLISNPKGVNIGPGPLYTYLPKGTRVVETPGFPSMVETYIKVIDGSHVGKTGKVMNSDLSDERN